MKQENMTNLALNPEAIKILDSITFLIIESGSDRLNQIVNQLNNTNKCDGKTTEQMRRDIQNIKSAIEDFFDSSLTHSRDINDLICILSQEVKIAIKSQITNITQTFLDNEHDIKPELYEQLLEQIRKVFKQICVESDKSIPYGRTNIGFVNSSQSSNILTTQVKKTRMGF